ncbi:MAG: HAMP domain-containing sensor histidine kinase [Cyclobacteriaceae bacterium]
MSLSRFSVQRHLLALLIIVLAGTGVVYVIVAHVEEGEQKQRKSRLADVNNHAAIEFSESLDRFVYLMSGIRSYLKHSESFPTQEKLFDFVNFQLNQLNYTDSLIISYIDQNHLFKYSFTRTEIDPNNLIGRSVGDFRDSVSLSRIENAMMGGDFHLFAATNLVEGWVGIPLHFGIVRDEKLLGYIAAIINFEAIIDPVYKFEPSKEFVFRFSINGTEFDRERAYDGSTIHHDRIDSLYFRNFSIDEDQYVYSDFERYGLNFKIGTAYLEAYTKDQDIDALVYGWYLMIVLFAAYSLYRIVRFKTLNEVLNESVETVKFQKTKLDIQNAELNKLNQTKDKFFSIIGHDLRGPLTSITSIVGLWNRKSLSGKQTDEFMEKLGAASRGASSLLDNLLLWSLVNTGQIKWNPEEIDVNQLVDEVFFQLGGSAASKQIHLEKDIPEGIVLHGDRNMMSTIVRNLTSNAIKFSNANSQVKVSIDVSETLLTLRVIDQGKGLSEQERSSLFLLGEGPSEVRQETGTGLGLVLVREFVNRHNGTISVQSELDKGTIFVIKFPAQ